MAEAVWVSFGVVRAAFCASLSVLAACHHHRRPAVARPSAEQDAAAYAPAQERARAQWQADYEERERVVAARIAEAEALSQGRDRQAAAASSARRAERLSATRIDDAADLIAAAAMVRAVAAASLCHSQDVERQARDAMAEERRAAGISGYINKADMHDYGVTIRDAQQAQARARSYVGSGKIDCVQARAVTEGMRPRAWDRAYDEVHSEATPLEQQLAAIRAQLSADEWARAEELANQPAVASGDASGAR